MNIWIALYFVCGACFGLATFSRKHLFSEGPERPVDAANRQATDGRLVWVLICAGLWPLMALTGLWSFWRPWRRRVASPRDHDR